MMLSRGVPRASPSGIANMAPKWPDILSSLFYEGVVVVQSCVIQFLHYFRPLVPVTRIKPGVLR